VGIVQEMFKPDIHPGSVLTGPLVKRFPMNEHGRDFVVGDLHGAFKLLESALEQVGFDADVDRLFCVGDLIDRGPDSAQVRNLLNKPYFHSVLGNHDYDFACMTSREAHVHAIVNYHGMGWAKVLPEHDIHAIQDALRACPLVIEVETLAGVTGIVHAQVPTGVTWQDFVADINSGRRRTLATALESRSHPDQFEDVPGIHRVFVGHDPKFLGAERRGNVWSIDTGAVYRQEGVVLSGFNKVVGMLTLVNLAADVSDLEMAAPGDDCDTAVIQCSRDRARG